MNEGHAERTDGRQAEVGIWDYFYVLYKWRKFIVINVFVIT
jgi:hypothetical protein